MRGRTLMAVLAVSLMVASGTALAQSNVTTGEILGTVQDADGGVLPGVNVVARNTDTGFSRNTTTGPEGSYTFQFVPVGPYTVRAELAGFRPEVRQSIRVSLGTSVRVNFTLQLGNLEEEIVVTGAAPLVETTRPDVASTVTSEQIENLPLNGRDFLDFIALTPMSTTDDNGRSHIGGMRGIQNSFNIDGASSQSNFFGEERGGTRPPFTFSQGAIAEFQVIPSSYNVQFGNASGGIVNAITKSGTNEIRGEAWYYFRDQSFVDNDALGRAPTDFDQKQFGAALGGPFIKDKLHYFVSYDGQLKSYPVYRNFYNFPAGREAEFEAKTGLTLSDETGGNQTSTDDADVILGKVDWQLSSNVLVTFRHNYSSHTAENGTDTRYTTTGFSNNGLEENTFNSSVLNLNAVLSAKAFNEFIFQFSKEERPRTANNSSIPEVRIASGYDALFGQRNYLPNNLIEEHTQLIDNFTYFLGEHAIKAGFNFDMVKYDNWFPRYSSTAGPRYYFRSWNDFFIDKVYEYTQAFYDNDGHAKFDINYYSGYLQDEWRVNPSLTVNAGIRYDLQANPTPTATNPDYPDTGSIPDDTNNWAPRVGFAWDPVGDGRTVVRGGAGYFYDTTPALLFANVMLNNGISGVRYVIRCSSSNPCPAFPDVLSGPGGAAASTPSIFAVNPDFENPKTKRFSIGVEQAVGDDYAFGGEFVWSETSNMERLVDANLEPVGFTPWGANLFDYRTVKNSNFATIAEVVSNGRARYWAAVLKGRKRFSDNWTFNASYTYSKANDNNSNERSASVNDYSMGEDPFNPDESWGPSDYDVTHRFVGSATVLLPLDFQLSTIVTFSSGYPYTPNDGRCWNVSGSYCNDPYAIQYRAYYAGKHYGRNSFRQPYYRNIDLRLAKIFKIRAFEIEIIGEAFNVTAEDNLRTSNTEMVTDEGTLNDRFSELNIAGSPRQYQLGLKVRF